jgi:bifunctional non-homologous end joining protein LigD
MKAPAAPLEKYRARRNFQRTPEPPALVAEAATRLSYVVQRHAARRLHYDLRLEWKGVLKSWAVTRGPSLDPADKRLAVEVEDHPVAYGDFEGTIPPPDYGAGIVQLWDRGLWAPLHPDQVENDLAKGELKFVLSGERLKGGFVLIRLKPRKGERQGVHNWLLIKERDSMARPGEGDAVLKAGTSVKSGLTMEQIGQGKKAAAAMPDFIPPQLCTLVSTPPGGAEWVHELKLDGYRMQLRVAGGEAQLRTRTGLDWTGRFPAIAKAAARLPDGILDGEAMVLDGEGQPSFGLLQACLAGEKDLPIIFVAFDLLHDGDAGLREKPLHQRKAALRQRLPDEGKGTIRYLSDFTAPGGAVLASACQLHMEGIVSKRRDAPYVSGRDGDWVKAKCRGREEFVVGGWSAQGSGHGLGALLLGTHREGRFAYVGRVGTGFNQRTAAELVKRLSALAIATSPFIGKQPAVTRGVTWAKPELVVEVAYGGWTEEGILRHASFQGIREDKPAGDVAPEPVKAAPVTRRRPTTPGLTHPERVLWPATETTPALTKADLAAHYARFADRILEHVAGRPLSVLRAPEGIEGELFFQRHAMRGQSPLIASVTIEGQARPYMRIDDAAGLAALAQISAVELHPWGSRADQPEVAERLVFDLDPAPDLPFDAVVAGALELRRRLTGLGLTPFPRVTGGKGLHLVVPLKTDGEAADWEMVKSFARLVCAMMEQDEPTRYTTKIAKRAREGRIFLDYLRNDRLATAIANFSPRARPGAPVACPVSWAMVKPGLDPAGFRLPELAAKPLPRDPWRGFAAAASPITDAMRQLTRG